MADLIERSCGHALAIVNGIGSLEGAEILWTPTINQGLIRFVDPREGATEQDHDRYTDRVLAGILADGEAFFTGSMWRRKRCMRVSVCNWQTSAADVDRVVASVSRVLAGLREVFGQGKSNPGYHVR